MINYSARAPGAALCGSTIRARVVVACPPGGRSRPALDAYPASCSDVASSLRPGSPRSGRRAGCLDRIREPGASERRVSIIIPHLNQDAYLARCLACLKAGSRPPDEVIVVDNGSRRLPESICAAWPEVRLVIEGEPGPGPARNRGVREASGDIVAFLDADCLPSEWWLRAIDTAFRDPHADILGGDVRIACHDAAKLTMIEAYESVYAFRMERYIKRQGFTGTGNLAVRREVLEAVGPFAGLHVAEDREWGHRATAQGYRIRYVADMKVAHPPRESFAELRAKWDRQTAHDFAAARELPAGRVRWAVKMGAMLASPLAEIGRVFSSRRIEGWRSRLLAFSCVVRIRWHRAKVMAQLMGGENPKTLSGRWNRDD